MNSEKKVLPKDYDEFTYNIRAETDAMHLCTRLDRYHVGSNITKGDTNSKKHTFFMPMYGTMFTTSPNGEFHDKLVIRTAKRDDIGLVDTVIEIETALGHKLEPVKKNRSASS